MNAHRQLAASFGFEQFGHVLSRDIVCIGCRQGIGKPQIGLSVSCGHSESSHN
jgi:hypothetical protein